MSRVTFRCTMQEGQVDEGTRAVLADGLRRIAVDLLGESADDVPVSFSDIPAGFGFRGGAPSTTSLVRGAIVGGVDQELREQVMRAVIEMWTDVSGCTVDELIVSAADA